LDATHSTDQKDCAVEDTQRSLHLDREVDVAGGVDEVDVVGFPLQVGGCGLDCDAFLAFELHEVHLGAHLVGAFDFVD
jgi:hypothetical protein